MQKYRCKKHEIEETKVPGGVELNFKNRPTNINEMLANSAAKTLLL